ncbi:MAG: DUF4190 domain-containing protein [Cytophagales bacterium]|nr:DUF4190 domain-containing protein [Cytophagales bacterium]MDW8384228.1 DUF4190 domain-containing protein [Flammeovirgaceae bacterium]
MKNCKCSIFFIFLSIWLSAATLPFEQLRKSDDFYHPLISKNCSWSSETRSNPTNPKTDDPQVTPSEKRRIHWSNIAALASGVLAYVSFPELLLFFLPAVVFGAIGIAKSGRKKKFGGLGMGIAGFVLGLIGLFLVVMVIIIFATYFP